MNKQTFLHAILNEFYGSIHKLEENNFDYLLFNRAGERQFDHPRHLKYANFFFNNYDQLYSTFLMFNNHESQDLFIRLILYRLLGHNHVNITNKRSTDLEAGKDHVLKHQKGESKFDVEMLGRKIQHFKGYEFRGQKLDFDCLDLNLIHGPVFGQYFYDHDETPVRVEDGDVVIDAGSCLGDTATMFASVVGDKGFVYSFDMLPLHMAITQHNIDQNGFTDRFQMVGYGVSNQSQGEEVKPDLDDNTVVNPALSLHANKNLPTITIDDFVRKNNVEKVDFIKMDIEGFELAALHGANATIQQHKPKLAISIYHMNEDYISIPHYLKSEFPFYDFYLGHYTIYDQETILYAIAK
jgi:FkbM family methyltransferase